MDSALSRRRFLSGAAIFGRARAVRAQDRRPNIIVLLTDDQRWDTLGCMGNGIIRTPNIDAMAAEGVVFTNQFVTTSICMTSRASIFSGLYLRTHQINDFQKPFGEEQYARTYPEILRRAGYRTGFIGKWGVGNQMPADRFDYFRGFPGQGHYFPERPDETLHLTQVMGDESLDFLRGSKPDRPFCLSVSFKAPHVQDEDPRQFLHSRATAELYRDVDIAVPKTADPRYIAMLPIEVQRSEARRRWAVRFSTPALYQQSVKSYYRLITEVDTVVGRIREQLERMRAADNTIILFTSDNGFYLAEHGLAGKWFMHEESIRVPLVVYDPRLESSRRGQRRNEMTLNIDVAPTLIHYAGAKAPPMQGRNLRPLVEQQKVAWRREWFYEHLFEHAWIPRTEGVRTTDRKYTRYLDTQPVFEELFDLRADPLEERNLIREAGQHAQAAELRELWKVWREALEGWRGDRAWQDPA